MNHYLHLGSMQLQWDEDKQHHVWVYYQIGGVYVVTSPYLCPNCKTNRSRFNIIEQVARPVRMDPQNGQIVNDYSNGEMDMFHMAYKGPSYKVQCGTCGLIEEERTFIKHAENNPRG